MTQTECDLLWGKWPNGQLLQTELKTRKVNAAVTAIGDQKLFFFIKNLNPHYFLNILVIYGTKAFRKW